MKGFIKDYKAIILILISALLVLLFVGLFFYVKNSRGIFSSGEYGNLLAGTIGVAVNIFALSAILLTLWEQQKVTKQTEVHHLVENFNSRFDKFILLANELKDTIDELWIDKSDKDTIQSNLNQLTNRLRNETSNCMDRLESFCQDENLIKISYNLNRLLFIKNKIQELDMESAKRINEDWNSIENYWKKYAGFYFAWSPRNQKLPSENEMVADFYEVESKMPADRPRIFLEEKLSKEVVIEDLKKLTIPIETKNDLRIIISKVIISFGNENPFENKFQIELEPNVKKDYELGDILHDKIDEIKGYIKGKKIIKGSIFSDIEMSICKEKEELKDVWIYEGILEFYFPTDNTITVIAKQYE